MYYKNSFQDKPEFNMAVMFLTRLDNRLNEKDLATQQGDIITWYRIIRNVYNTIYFKVEEYNDTEINKKIHDLFKQIEGYIKSLSNQNIAAASITNAEIKLREVDLLVNNLLYKYHLIFPKKHTKTFQEEIEDDY